MKFSLTVFTESFGEEELLGNTCSISFGLHDINIDAHNFYNLAKKEEENSTIKFLFLSVDDYERSLSFLSEACNGMKYEIYSCFDEAICSFSLYSKQIVGEKQFWFMSKLFLTSFKPEITCDG